MNFRKITWGIVIITFLAILGFSSGVNQFQYIFDRLEMYSQIETPEKIYLHTDKQYYTNGEIIWFKSYLVNGITHTGSAKSKVSYVELINPNDSIVARRTIYTNRIGAAGDIQIDKNWVSGTYLLRSYTNYMRNAEKQMFFQKKIPIWNQKINEEEIYGSYVPAISLDSLIGIDTTLSHKPVGRPKLRFYPEGGQMVANMDNTLGIHVTDDQGTGIPILGDIKDEDGHIIVPFRSYKYGLGKVTFKPKLNKKYIASVIINDKEEIYPLPQIQKNGYRLGVRNTGDNITIDVESTQKNGLYNTLLIGHLRGKMFFKHIEPKGTDTYSLKLVMKDLDDGVAHFTLFTPSGEAVCERLTFIDNPENDVKLEIQPDKKIYGNRERIGLDIAITDTKGTMLNGDFSMSVVSSDSLDKNYKTSDIRSWLLLDSDLKGTIENPGYFFDEDGSNKKKFLLDALMLTHGWRRFVWKEFLRNGKPKKETFSPELGVFIKGKTTMYDQPFATKQSLTSLTFLEKGLHQEQKLTSTTGRFSFGPFIFKDTVSAVIEAVLVKEKNKNKKKNLSIFIDSPLPAPAVEHFDRKKNIPINVDYIQNYLAESRLQKVTDFRYNPDATQLDEVILSVKKKSVSERLADKYGESPNRLIIDSVLGASSKNVVDILRQMPRVSVLGAYPDLEITIRGGGLRLGSPSETQSLVQSTGQVQEQPPQVASPFSASGPLILVDEVEVPLDLIISMSASEVLFIDVLRGNETFLYGSRGNEGVISIFTDRGSDFLKKQDQAPGITNFKIEGLYQAREFFAPDYSQKKPEQFTPDYRTTLFWNPSIYTNEKERTKIDFYTSDNKGKYLIKIEGITEDGRVIKNTKEISIQ